TRDQTAETCSLRRYGALCSGQELQRLCRLARYGVDVCGLGTSEAVARLLGQHSPRLLGRQRLLRSGGLPTVMHRHARDRRAHQERDGDVGERAERGGHALLSGFTATLYQPNVDMTCMTMMVTASSVVG